MRRLLVFILLLLVPLQFAWSMAAALQGHEDEARVPLGVHAHDHADHAHDHDDSAAADATDEWETGHSDDGHHDHYHPTFSPVLLASILSLDAVKPREAVTHSPPACLSYIPALFDRPPLARA